MEESKKQSMTKKESIWEVLWITIHDYRPKDDIEIIYEIVIRDRASKEIAYKFPKFSPGNDFNKAKNGVVYVEVLDDDKSILIEYANGKTQTKGLPNPQAKWEDTYLSMI